jgi:RNase P/RNase MRP subunit POP5
MKLLKSLKQKKRYIVFDVSEEYSLLDLKSAVETALGKYFGQLGMSKVSPLFVKAEGKRFILKVNHQYVDETIAGIILIKKIKNTPVIVKSVIVSGTLKKAGEKL